ncbi:MAG: S1 family peptidase [Thermoguttaceae bacterium]
MKTLLPLIVLASTTLPAAADFWSGLSPDQPHPAVVRVVVSEGQTMSLGSGTLVAVRGRHGLVVTNWHVVRDAKGPINVVFADGFRSGASVLGTDADWDLAALAIWRPNVEPVAISQRAPQPEDELSIAGYGAGAYRSASGRCVQYISPGGNQPFEMLELSATARDGDSGGPIFNDRGELAGVLFGATRGRTAGSSCGRVAWFLASVAPRFDALSNPPADTMIAQDFPTSPVSSRPAGPLPAGIATDLPGRPADTSWEPAWSDPSKTGRQASRRRSMPLASIPAPALEQGRNEEQPPPVVEKDLDEGAAESPVSIRPAPMPLVVPVATPALAPAALPAGPTPAETAMRWLDLLGPNRPEQARNFLAILGVVAILFHSAKVLAVVQMRPVRRRSSSRRRSLSTRRPIRRRVRVWW